MRKLEMLERFLYEGRLIEVWPYSEYSILKVNDTLGGIILAKGWNCTPYIQSDEYLNEAINTNVYGDNENYAEWYFGEVKVDEMDTLYSSAEYEFRGEIWNEKREFVNFWPMRFCRNGRLELISRRLSQIRWSFYVYEYFYSFGSLRDGRYSFCFIKVISAKTLAEMIMGLKPWHLGIRVK